MRKIIVVSIALLFCLSIAYAGGFDIQTIKVERISIGLDVKVKVTNNTGRTVKYGTVTCVLLKNKKMVDIQIDHIQGHYANVPMLNGASYYQVYFFKSKSKIEFDEIIFDVTEIEYQ